MAKVHLRRQKRIPKNYSNGYFTIFASIKLTGKSMRISTLPRHSGTLLIGKVVAMTRGSPGEVAATTRGIAVDVAPMTRKVAPMTGMARTTTRFAAPRAMLELLTLLLLSTILASTRPEGTVCSITFLVSTVLHAFVGTAAVGVPHTNNLHANAALTCRIASSVSFYL